MPSRTLKALLCASTALAAPAMAQVAPGVRPTGGQVSAGQASIGGNATTTTISQSSQNAVINWQTYNLGAAQTVQYSQPNAASFTLNRVITPQPSQIAGHIVANGRIAIVNQSGVVFLNGSTVDTAGLVVSAAGISDQDFMAGRLVFGAPARPGATVSNAGSITIRQAGLAALVAPQVANSGVITAQLGRVILGGATTHTLDFYGDGLVALNVTGQVTQVQIGGKPVTALVTNTGTILAPGGTVVLTAQAADGVVSTAISAGGTISAPTVGLQTGRVLVSGIGGDVEIEGAVSASGVGTGGAGGQVEVNGNRGVILASGAAVDASGDSGGGLAAIGTTAAHARTRATPAILTASRTTVVTGAAIRANGGLRGHGGTIAIASGGRTSVSGSVSASGGAISGDGGTISVDGATNFVDASIDTLAPHGIVGQSVLNNLVGTAYIGNLLPAGSLPTDPCIVGSCYSLSGITGFSKILNSHGDVDFIYNSSASNLLQNISYTLDVLTTGAGHSINIDAGVRIDVDQITLKSSGGVFLDTSNYTLFNPLGLPSIFKAPTAAATLTAQTSIDLDAVGAISAGPGFGGVTGALVAPLLAITGAGSVTLDSTRNSVATLGGASPVGGNFTFTDARGLSVTSPISAMGDVFISVSGAADALVSSAAIGGANIYLQSGGGMNLGGDLSAASGSSAGTIGLAALGGDMTVSGAVTAGTLAASASGVFSASNAANLVGTIGSSASDVVVSGIAAGKNISLVDGMSLNVISAIKAGGTLTLSDSGAVALQSATVTATAISLTAGAGLTQTGGLLDATQGTLSVSAPDFAQSGATAGASGGVTVSGELNQIGSDISGSTVGVGGGVTQSASTLSGGSVTVGGSVGQSQASLIDATGGSVLIGAAGGAGTLTQARSTITATGDVLVTLGGDLLQDASSLIATTGASNRISIASSGGALSIGGTLSANQLQGLVSLQASAGTISEAAGGSQTGTILAGTLAAEAGLPGSSSGVLYDVLLDTASSATVGNRIGTLSGIVSAGTTISGATGTFSLNDGSDLVIARGVLVVASNEAAGAATPGSIALQSGGGIVNAGILQAGTRSSVTGIFAGDVLLNALSGSITELGGSIETGRLAAAATGIIDLSTASTLSPTGFNGNQISEIVDLTTTFGVSETVHGLSAYGTIRLVDGQNLAIDAQVLAVQPQETTGVISLDITSGTLVPDQALPTSPILTIGTGGEIVLDTLSPVFVGQVSLMADHYDFSAAGPTAISAPGAVVALDLALGRFSDVIDPGLFVVSDQSGVGATILAGDIQKISTYSSVGGLAGAPLWGTLALGSENGFSAGNTGSLLIESRLDLTQAYRVARDLGLFSTGDITSDAGLILDDSQVGGTLYGSAGSAVPHGHGFATIIGGNAITLLGNFSTLGEQTPGAATTLFDLTDEISLFVSGPVNGDFVSPALRPILFNGDVDITVNGDGNALTIGAGARVNGNDVALSTTGVAGAATAVDLAADSIVTAWGGPPTTGGLGGTVSVTAAQGGIAVDGLLQNAVAPGALPAVLGRTDLLADRGDVSEANSGTIVTGTLAVRAGAREGAALYSVRLDSTQAAGASSNRIGTLASLDAQGSGATDVFSIIDGSGLVVAAGAFVEAGNSAGISGHAGSLSLTVGTAQAGDLAIDGVLQAGTLATVAPGIERYVGSMILDDAATVQGAFGVSNSITEGSSGALRAYSLNVNATLGEVLLEAAVEPRNVVEHVVGSNMAAGRFDFFDDTLIATGGATLPMQNVFVDAGASIRGAAIDIQVADGNLNLEAAMGLPGAVIAGGSTVSLSADLGVLQFGGTVSGNEIQIVAGAEFAQFAGGVITALPLPLIGMIGAPTIDITAGTRYAAGGFANDIILADGNTISLNGIALGGTVSALATGGVGSVTLSTPGGDISQTAPNDATNGAPTSVAPAATGTIIAGSVAFQAGAVSAQPSAAGGTLSNVWLTASGNQIGTLGVTGGLSGAAGAVSVTDATDLALAQDATLSADGPVTLSLAGHTLTQLASGILVSAGASAGAVAIDAALVVQDDLGVIQSGSGFSASGAVTQQSRGSIVAIAGDVIVLGDASQVGGSAITAASGNIGIGGSLAQSGSTATAAQALSVAASLTQTASVAQAGGLAVLLGGGRLVQAGGSTLSGGTGVELTLAGGMSQDSASVIESAGGGIGIDATAGDIAFAGTIRAGGTSRLVTLVAQDGAIDSSTGTVDAGVLAASAAGSLLLGGANAVDTIAPATTFDGMALAGLSSGSAITLRDTVALAVNSATVDGIAVDVATTSDLQVMGSTMIAQTGQLSLSAASITLGDASAIEGQGGLTLTAPGAVVEDGGTTIISAAGAVLLAESGSFMQTSASVSGETGVSLASAGAIQQQGGLIVSGEGAVQVLASASLTQEGGSQIAGMTGVTLASSGSVTQVFGNISSAAGVVEVLQSGSLMQAGGSSIRGYSGVSLASAGGVTQVGGIIESDHGAVLLARSASFTQAGGSSVEGLAGVSLASSGAVVQADAASFIRSDGALTTLSISTPDTMSFAGTLSAPRILLGETAVAGVLTADALGPRSISWAGGTIETGSSQAGLASPSQAIISGPASQQGLFAQAAEFSQTGTTKVTAVPGTGGEQTVQLTLETPGGTIAFDPRLGNTYGLIAPQTQLFLDLQSSGTASGNIVVGGLIVTYAGSGEAGGTKFLNGSVDGRTGSAAAASSFIHPIQASNYELNGCPIQSINCVLLSPLIVPAGSPVRDLEVSVVHRREDDDDLILPNVAEQDY